MIHRRGLGALAQSRSRCASSEGVCRAASRNCSSSLRAASVYCCKPAPSWCSLPTIRTVIRRRHLSTGNGTESRKERDGASTHDIKAARFSKELYTIPNMITISRIVASPWLALAIAYDQKEVALAGCMIAGFSDWLDGYIAKNYNQMTVLGGMIDPIADKFMVGSLTAGLAYKGLLPLELAGVIIGRDVVLVLASFAIRWYEMPKGSPFFDTTYSATFEIVPSTLSKLNTGAQFLLLSCTLSHFALGFPAIDSLEPLWWITGGMTVLSGADYLRGSGVRRLQGAGSGKGRGLDDAQYTSSAPEESEKGKKGERGERGET